MKPLKRTGLCKVFLDFDRRAAVTFRPLTWRVEGKLPSNLMKRMPKASIKENQTNQQCNASEAERKVSVQFTNDVEELTSLKKNKQSESKQQLDNPSTTRREELQSTAHRCDMKLSVDRSPSRGKKYPNNCKAETSLCRTKQTLLKNF